MEVRMIHPLKGEPLTVLVMPTIILYYPEYGVNIISALRLAAKIIPDGVNDDQDTENSRQDPVGDVCGYFCLI